MFKSRVNYRALLDSIGVPVISLNKEWKISYVNEAYADMVDHSIAELEGRILLELFPDKVGTPSYSGYLQVLETKQPKCIEFESKGRVFRENIYPAQGGFISIIQETHRVREEMRTSKSAYRAMFDEVNDALFVFDVNSNSIVDANRQASQMFGYDLAEILQIQLGDLSAEEPPFTKENVAHWIKKVASNNPEPQVVEWLTRDKSGRKFWIELKTISTYFEEREHLLVVVRDITEAKETQRRLRESSERYLDLFENSGDMIYVHDLDGNFIRVNKMTEKITGYWEEELLDMNISDLIAEESKSIHYRYKELGRRMAQQKKGKHRPISYEIEIEAKHGRSFLEVSTWLIYRNLEPIAIQGIARDITERKLEEISIRESQQMMADLLEFLPDALMAIDTNGKVFIWNGAMEELTGVPAEKMLGKDNYEYSLPFYGIRRPIVIDQVLRPEDIERDYTRIKQEHYVLTALVEAPVLRGEKHQIWCKAVPLYDRNGMLLGAVETIREMTEVKRIQDSQKTNK